MSDSKLTINPENSALVRRNEDDFKVSFPKFAGSDFSVWRAQILAILTDKKLDCAVTENLPESDPRNLKVKSILLSSVDNETAKLVIRFNKSKDIWDRLNEAHEQRSKSTLPILQNQFYLGKQIEGERVIAYISRMEYLASQTTDLGCHINESELASRIVSGLNGDFRQFRFSWLSAPESSQNTKYLISRLEAEEQIVLEDQQTVSLIAGSQKPKPKPETSTKREGNCNYCKKPGHWVRECRKLMYNKAKKNQEANIEETNQSQDEEEPLAIMAETTLACKNDYCILDSGATDHMTHDETNLVSYRPVTTSRVVKFGGTQTANIVGTGDMPISVGEGKLMLKNVLYVPTLRRKLISVSRLANRDLAIEINKDIMTIKRGNKVVLTGRRDGNLYSVEATEGNVESNFSVAVWHRRLGHVNNQTIKLMNKHKTVIGLDNISTSSEPQSSEPCKPCQLSKLTRHKIPLKTTPKSSIPGDRIHSDIAGPIDPISHLGKRYFILFKDECSNFRTAYTLRSKEEAHDSIPKAIAYFKSLSNRKLSCLITDNGSVYTSKRTQDLLSRELVRHITSPAYYPAANGFIERDMRTVMEMTRTLLNDAPHIPKTLWDEALRTSIYRLNRTASTALPTTTPYELMLKRKPRVDYFRAFGSLGYSKTLEKKRSGYQKKLEDRAKVCYLVGYEYDYTYRILDPTRLKVEISKDIVFDEKPLEPRPENTVQQVSEKEHFETTIENENETNTDETKNDEAPANPLDNNRNAEIEEEKTSETNYRPVPTTSRLNKTQMKTSTTKPQTRAYSLRPREAHLCTEPLTYGEAVSSPDRNVWVQAINNELAALEKNNTWRVVGRNNQKTIKTKWIFKTKTDGTHKARLVVKGYEQRYGIDFGETFAPVVRGEALRVLLSLTARLNWSISQFDITSAFLNGDLDEEVYIEPPEGTDIPLENVCRLQKALYGLKQAPRCWSRRLSDALKQINYEPLICDKCIFVNRMNNELKGVVLMYVDDGLTLAPNQEEGLRIITRLNEVFNVKTLTTRTYIGLEIEREDQRISIHQETYINKLAAKFLPNQTPQANLYRLAPQTSSRKPQNTLVTRHWVVL